MAESQKPIEIPEIPAPELFQDSNGVNYRRTVINERWVRYVYFDESGTETSTIAIPRVEVFTPDDIARLDQLFA